MKLDQRLIAALIGVVDDPHGLRSDSVPDAIKPGDQDEAAGYPLALYWFVRHHSCLALFANVVWERIENIVVLLPKGQVKVFFEFPEDARWNDKREAVEFSVILRRYEGTVRIARRVFQGLLDQRPTSERCLEAFHLQRTRFELIVERKLRRRQLTDDGNVEITGRDLRERTPPAGQRDFFHQSAPTRL